VRKTAWHVRIAVIPSDPLDAHRDDRKRFIVAADEKLSAFVELERQVLTVTFYLESIHRQLVS
jgi:hypothetical protein